MSTGKGFHFTVLNVCLSFFSTELEVDTSEFMAAGLALQVTVSEAVGGLTGARLTAADSDVPGNSNL